MWAIKKPSNGVFGDIVVHDIGLLFDGHGFESKAFRFIKRDYFVNNDNITIAKT